MTDATRLRDSVVSLFTRSPARWIVLSLVSVAILGTAAYNYREINSELTAVALARRETVAQLAAITLAEKFGRMVDIAISLANRTRVEELVAQGKWVEASKFLRTVPKDLPQIERLFLAYVRGTLRADVPPLPGVRGKNFAFREWYQGVRREWQPYVSPVYLRTAVPRLNVFAVSVPIKNSTGRVMGILVLQIRIENLFEWIKTVGADPGGFIYIVDSKGQLAFHSRRQNPGSIVDLTKSPVVQKMRLGGHGVIVGFDPRQQEESIIAYALVPGYGWGVVAQQPTHASPSYAARDAQLRRLLTGYGLILLLGTATIFMASRIAVERQRAEDDRRMKTELEQRVRERTTQLDAANKELEAFSYSVSHDLRAPLRSIDGFSQALMEDYPDKLDEEGRHYLTRMRAGTQRMAELIDDLLQLSRVTRAEMRHETVDLSALAESVVADLQRTEPQRKVEIVIHPDLTAEGDPKLLRIVLVNLLANAWKFTARQPDARIVLGIQKDNDGNAYYVRDNGVGFDMAYADRLFGAFQRLHAANEFPGTGIGLATVQRIVRRHGGRVWAEGAVNQGATFYFTLPSNHSV